MDGGFEDTVHKSSLPEAESGTFGSEDEAAQEVGLSGTCPDVRNPITTVEREGPRCRPRGCWGSMAGMDASDARGAHLSPADGLSHCPGRLCHKPGH